MDKVLAKIVKEALESPRQRCPKCEVEGITRGSGEITWCECPKCGEQIGELTVM